MLKSTAHFVPDLEKLELPDELFEVDFEVIASEKKNIRMKYAEYIHYDQIEKNSLVTVDLRSSIDKFNKKDMKAVVGLGLFHPDLETELVGMTVDSTKKVEVEGKSVTMTVKEIKKQKLPTLTDELIQKEIIEDVFNVEEYETYLFEKQVTEKMDKIFREITSKIFEKSDVTIVGKDIDHLYGNELVRINQLCENEGKTLENLTEKEVIIRLGRNLEDFEKFLKEDWFPFILNSYLAGKYYAEEEGLVLDGKDKYEEHLLKQRDDDRVRESEVEVLRNLTPYTNYQIQQYMTYFQNQLRSFLVGKFKEINKGVK